MTSDDKTLTHQLSATFQKKKSLELDKSKKESWVQRFGQRERWMLDKGGHKLGQGGGWAYAWKVTHWLQQHWLTLTCQMMIVLLWTAPEQGFRWPEVADNTKEQKIKAQVRIN